MSRRTSVCPLSPRTPRVQWSIKCPERIPLFKNKLLKDTKTAEETSSSKNSKICNERQISKLEKPSPPSRVAMATIPTQRGCPASSLRNSKKGPTDDKLSLFLGADNVMSYTRKEWVVSDSCVPDLDKIMTPPSGSKEVLKTSRYLEQLQTMSAPEMDAVVVHNPYESNKKLMTSMIHQKVSRSQPGSDLPPITSTTKKKPVWQTLAKPCHWQRHTGWQSEVWPRHATGQDWWQQGTDWEGAPEFHTQCHQSQQRRETKDFQEGKQKWGCINIIYIHPRKNKKTQIIIWQIICMHNITISNSWLTTIIERYYERSDLNKSFWIGNNYILLCQKGDVSAKKSIPVRHPRERISAEQNWWLLVSQHQNQHGQSHSRTQWHAHWKGILSAASVSPMACSNLRKHLNRDAMGHPWRMDPWFERRLRLQGQRKVPPSQC